MISAPPPIHPTPSGVIGIGFDVCDHKRIIATWQRFGARFLRRLYTPLEQTRAFRGNPVLAATLTPPQQAAIGARLARLFAAKEAGSKMLGVGIAQGVGWRDIEVHHAPSGAPRLELHGRAAQLLARLTQNHPTTIHLTLSSENDVAYALVIASAQPHTHP